MSFLTKSFSFKGFPDGRLRAGPFPFESISEISQKMTEFGMFIGDDSQKGWVSWTARGMMISASGPSVRGYFLEKDGLEVEQDRLEAFLMSCLPLGSAVTVSGHYQECPDVMVCSKAVYHHLSNGKIAENSRRWVEHKSGRRNILSATSLQLLDLAVAKAT
jgi:hypothetical protein